MAFENVTAMRLLDRMALAFSALMVAMTMMRELKDIELVMAAAKQAADRLARRWRVAVTLLNGVRRWVFLPALLIDVPTLVLYRGGELYPKIDFVQVLACQL